MNKQLSKQMVPYLERQPGDDCFSIAVSNILKHMDYPLYKAVWKQCGLLYTKLEDAEVGSLSGRFLPSRTELQWVHGIQATNTKIDEAELFMAAIRQRIDQEEPVMVAVDTYELPYNINYQHMHSSHYVTVVGYEADSFRIVDDFYKYQGTISYEGFITASKYLYGWPVEKWMNRNFYSFSLEESKGRIERQDYVQVLRMNDHVLSGQASPAELRQMKNAPETLQIFAGLDSIDLFLEAYHSYAADPELLTRELFNSLYVMLSDVANTRYLYTEFLKGAVDACEGFQDLVEAYTEIGQDWKVSANMMLKGVMTDQTQKAKLLERMFTKVKLIQTKEQHALGLGRQLLDLLEGSI